MNNLLHSLIALLRALIVRQDGQDLIEYGLIATLIALAAMAGMDNVAEALVPLFNNIGTSIT